VLPWKRGANEALGAGWLLRHGFCAPAPCALFAASANLKGDAISAEIDVFLLLWCPLKIAVPDQDIFNAERSFVFA
jgi:hypothetical protein